MTNNASGWAIMPFRNDHERRVFEEERLVLDVTSAFVNLMNESAITRADLAISLETSRANVTQILSGTRNMTLRSVARIAYELGTRFDFELSPLDRVTFTSLDYLADPVLRPSAMVNHEDLNQEAGAQCASAPTQEAREIVDYKLAA